MATPNTLGSRALQQVPPPVVALIAPVRAPRRPYTTTTPAPVRVTGVQVTRSGGQVEHRSDGSILTADQRRRNALELDRIRALDLCQLHHRRGDRDAYVTASRRVDHVDNLIRKGEAEGRWA